MKKRPKILLSVIFKPCGAEAHTAFSNAVLQTEGLHKGKYKIDFPYHVDGILTSRRAQAEWANGKLSHLRSWGERGMIVEE